MKKSIDINCDVGELDDINDIDFIKHVSSVNICCGEHAGNPQKILAAIRAAKKYGVKIGAHPSYPDRNNFGRKSIDISKEDLMASLMEQILYIHLLCQKENAILHHVKPHGALYHDIMHMEDRLAVLLDVMRGIKTDLKFYGKSNDSLRQKIEKQGFEFRAEGFLDRRYDDLGSLVNRDKDMAIIDSVDLVKEQIDHLLMDKIVTISGKEISIDCQTVCLHSDTPAAAGWIEEIVNHIKNKGVDID